MINQETIGDLAGRLDSAIRALDAKIHDQIAQTKQLQNQLERMRTTHEKLHLLQWAEADADIVREFNP